MGALLGGEIRESEFNEDRLGRLLKDLGSGETAEDRDRELSAHCLRYYRLKTAPATVRLDTTSVAVQGDEDGGGSLRMATAKKEMWGQVLNYHFFVICLFCWR